MCTQCLPYLSQWTGVAETPHLKPWTQVTLTMTFVDYEGIVNVLKIYKKPHLHLNVYYTLYNQYKIWRHSFFIDFTIQCSYTMNP